METYIGNGSIVKLFDKHLSLPSLKLMKVFTIIIQDNAEHVQEPLQDGTALPPTNYVS
jgi:hypothetical protein